MAKICLGCLNPLPDADEVCRICGFSADTQNPAIALKIETELQGHYAVGRLVHEGSDSLFYLGYDKTLKEPCFIQEFYPSTLCERQEDGQILPLGGCKNTYADSQQQFHALMRGLARAKDLPSVIPIYDIFEENGTCYAVSDYCAGETLTKKIERAGGRIPWQEARPLFMSLTSGVQQLASAGIQHLAICPDNILVGEDGKPHLRGFSVAAARQVGSDLQPRLATGYAAPEQYQFDGHLSEAAEVYGLAATLFRTVTGNEPPAGNNRAEDSDDLFMSAEIADELTQEACIALFNALQVDPDERTASVAKFRQQLSLEPNVSALLDEDTDRTPAKKAKRLSTPLIIFFAVLAALLVVLAVVLLLLKGNGDNDVSEPAASLPSYQTTTTTTKPPVKYAIPKLVGQNYYDIYDDKTNGEFVIEIKQKEYSDQEAGIILSQEPEPGTSVDKGATITVVVSLGKDDTLIVPNVSNWEENQAKLYLEALGFRVQVDKLYVSDKPYGYVEDTDPPAETAKKKGDLITLRVSYVEETVESDDPVESDPVESDPDESDPTVSEDPVVSDDPTVPEDPADDNIVDGDELF